MVRTKNRYLTVRIVPQVPTKTLRFHDSVLYKCVLSHVQKFWGDYGLGVVERDFRVKYCNDSTMVAIIRCLHSSHKYVASTLPLITKIGDVRAKFHTLYTGATLIQCNKFVIKFQQQLLDRLVGEITSAKEREDFVKRVMEFDLEK